MSLAGTIVNGSIQLDGNPSLPEGVRVWVDFEAAQFEYPHPLAPYDREKEVAILRERIATMDAGGPGMTVDEVEVRIVADLNLPHAIRE